MLSGMKRWLTETVTYYAPSSLDDSGNVVYSTTPTIYSCRIGFRTQKIVDQNGIQIIQSPVIYFDENANININGKIVFSDGNTMIINQINKILALDGSIFALEVS